MSGEHRERERIAQESARIMLDEGVRDYAAAKRKATEQLMVGGRANLPSNLEVEDAMLERRRLFADADELAELQAMREVALRVMRRLNGFEPRLVGGVLKGTAGAGARATLHVFAESPETFLIALMDRGLRYREAERTLRIGGVQRSFPSAVLRVDPVEVEALIFPLDGLRQAPSSPVDGRPVRRAGVDEVAELVEGRLADLLGAERLVV
ncbi:hypothetical protein [Acidihalobacter ferrooxydans]|nr:hypothetical protein [Acidihalobacter ferrooxydans]